MRMIPKRRVFGIAVLVATIALAGGAIVFTQVVNPRVIEEIRREPGSQRAKKVLVLTLPSAREIPVNFLREGDTVYLGADFGWWRELRAPGAAVEVTIAGERYAGRALAVENDPALTQSVFARLRPTVPQWLPEWLDATLVVVALERNGHGAGSRAHGGDARE